MEEKLKYLAKVKGIRFQFFILFGWTEDGTPETEDNLTLPDFGLNFQPD
ncbi:hypothetical protein LV83_03315 [Algoriphagus yeomjeoni]|uniref:Uncharacterized protein n=1 Tax=Algoriphagus yeomjeoni TaxID=291403 RepID=A0A327P3D4_9BACT|nr:hypothetical protein LV83_03315 [Algoriphagus yeomjeoni]